MDIPFEMARCHYNILKSLHHFVQFMIQSLKIVTLKVPALSLVAVKNEKL